ncbi:MAG: ketoacyl-ACP synthase III [Desulfovibrionaceae bacterium]|nr:ketoacyl-ACP synthase III [Desulfovibrionaceae bacterium]
MMTPYQILGLGSFIPAKSLSNDDLAKIVDTDDEWIVTRTGIRSRHVLDDSQNTSDMGALAAQQALNNAHISPDQITHVIVSTCSPDHLCPNTACLVSYQLGIKGAMAFDLNAACSGFLYGLEVAGGILANRPDAVVLFVCAEALTRRVNWEDRTTCVLFGDGAAAAVLARSPQGLAQVTEVCCHADGRSPDPLSIGGGTAFHVKNGDPVDENFFIRMEGREVYRNGVRRMTEMCVQILEKTGLTTEDIDVIIPHQANLRIVESVASRLKAPMNKVFVNLDRFGNTSAASVPIALHEAMEAGRIPAGARVLLTAFGGGFTYGSAILQFSAPDAAD